MAKTLNFLLALAICVLCAVSAHDTDDLEPTDIEAKAVYKRPVPLGPVLLAENFDDIDKFKSKWIISQAKKDDIDEDIAKYDGELKCFKKEMLLNKK